MNGGSLTHKYSLVVIIDCQTKDAHGYSDMWFVTYSWPWVIILVTDWWWLLYYQITGLLYSLMVSFKDSRNLMKDECSKLLAKSESLSANSLSTPRLSSRANKWSYISCWSKLRIIMLVSVIRILVTSNHTIQLWENLWWRLQGMMPNF